MPSRPQPSSLEFAAGRALDWLAARAAKLHPGSLLGRLRLAGGRVLGADAVHAAREGDQAAAQAVEIWAEHVGNGIANAINTFDPDESSSAAGARWPASWCCGRRRGWHAATRSRDWGPAPRSASPVTVSARV
jgi:predicted NBD/HSP70 family sugar kinase